MPTKAEMEEQLKELEDKNQELLSKNSAWSIENKLICDHRDRLQKELNELRTKFNLLNRELNAVQIIHNGMADLNEVHLEVIKNLERRVQDAEPPF